MSGAGGNGNGQGRSRGRGKAVVPPATESRRPQFPQDSRRQGQPASSLGGGSRGPARQKHAGGGGPRQQTAGPRPSAPSSITTGRGDLHRSEVKPVREETIRAGPSAETMHTVPVGEMVSVGPGGDTRRGGNGDGNGNGNNRGAMRGKRVIHEVLKTRPAAVVSKKGRIGKPVTLQANYFRITKKPEWTLYQYEVSFSPDTELIRLRKGLLSQYQKTFGGYLFDGQHLFTAIKLNDELEFMTKTLRDEQLFKITIKFVGIISMYDFQYLQILNLILRRALEGLKLQLVGRNFFDALAKIDLREHKMQLWPGYLTSIRQHEYDILMCAEITHKVMRTETLYDILKKCINESRQYQDAFKREVLGMIVLTDYNNKTYRVDDVNFDLTPMSEFPLRKGGNISFKAYYEERYKLKIRDQGQPLLISKPTEKQMRGGDEAFVMLVPELCRATGLNDAMRADFSLMRAMADHTRVNPSSRIERLKKFNMRLKRTPDSMNVFNLWQFGLDENLVEMSGRILNEEVIVFGNRARVPAGREADWRTEFRRQKMFSSVDLRNWTVIVTGRNRAEAVDFIKCVIQAAQGMRMMISEPQYYMINDDRNQSYVNAIDTCARNDPQLIFCVCPNDNADRYSCIKKKLCVDRAIPSQVVVRRTITPKKGKPLSSLMSNATNVAIQMNCKLMGMPWMIELPLKGLMTVGFDVCHSTRDASKSYGALVATMDLTQTTKFFSSISEHHKGQELTNEIALNMTKALKEYRDLHGTLPIKILFYRDGVGDGQLHQVVNVELDYLIKRLNEIYISAGRKEGAPITYIVVSKKINTRYFLNGNNPPPGTVVDDVITLPERFDFFLVSQSVRQGTVSPTSYNILYDKMEIGVERLQILTYKFTHLYYNWSGTIKVPAMCQYAHKLAFLVAQSIHQSPSSLLEKQLYYL